MLEERLAPARSSCCAKRSALRARKPNSFMKDFFVTSRPSSPYANCTTDLQSCAHHEWTSKFTAFTPVCSMVLFQHPTSQIHMCSRYSTAGGKARRQSGFCVAQASSRASPIAVIPDCVVVVDAQWLKVLDEAALQVAGSGGLHRCVYQPLAPSHAVKVVLLQLLSPSEATTTSILALFLLKVQCCQCVHGDTGEGPARPAKVKFWVFILHRRVQQRRRVHLGTKASKEAVTHKAARSGARVEGLEAW